MSVANLLRISIRFHLVFFLLAGLFPQASRADQNLNCDAYAQAAIAQSQEAAKLQCGFGGPGWVNDYGAHFNWCRSNGVGIMDVSREDQNRAAALAQCKQTKTTTKGLGDGACAIFANTMIGFAGDNQELGCGFTDARYDNNYQGHYDWCRSGVTQSQVDENMNFARAEIEQCRKSTATKFVCAFYQGRMINLFERYNEACTGVLAPEDHLQSCVDNGGNQQWMDTNEAALQTKVTACEQNIVTYKTQTQRGTWLDGCFVGGKTCGQPVADSFCRSNARESGPHAGAKSFTSSSADFSIYSMCFDMSMGDKQGYTDAGGKCHCLGSCGVFTSITCEGNREN